MTTQDLSPTGGLDLPGNELTKAAQHFVAEVSPELVYNHSVRSYLFARAVAHAQGLDPGSDYDDELVFLSCLLHDLGATDAANGDQRFEVEGADAAARFLREHEVDPGRVKTVWEAIALHTSVGLVHRFGPVAAITGAGIGTDIVGSHRALLPTGFADLVHRQWPRHDLGYALSALIADQVEANPAKGIPTTLPAQMHQLAYATTPAPTWFDLLDASGWGDQPTT